MVYSYMLAIQSKIKHTKELLSSSANTVVPSVEYFHGDIDLWLQGFSFLLH